MPQEGQVNRANSSVGAPTCWPIIVCRITDRFNSWFFKICCFPLHCWHRCVICFFPCTMVVRVTFAGCPHIWHVFTRYSVLRSAWCFVFGGLVLGGLVFVGV